MSWYRWKWWRFAWSASCGGWRHLRVTRDGWGRWRQVVPWCPLFVLVENTHSKKRI